MTWSTRGVYNFSYSCLCPSLNNQTTHHHHNTTIPTTPPLPTTHQNPTRIKTPFFNTPNIPLPLTPATTTTTTTKKKKKNIATMPPTEKPTNLHNPNPPISTDLNPCHHLTHVTPIHLSKPITWPITPNPRPTQLIDPNITHHDLWSLSIHANPKSTPIVMPWPQTQPNFNASFEREGEMWDERKNEDWGGRSFGREREWMRNTKTELRVRESKKWKRIK